MSHFLLDLRQKQPTNAKIALCLLGFRAEWRCLLYTEYALSFAYMGKIVRQCGKSTKRSFVSKVSAEAEFNDRIEVLPYATPDSKVTVCDISEETLPYAKTEQKCTWLHSTNYDDQYSIV
jgi:hypothetical protein